MENTTTITLTEDLNYPTIGYGLYKGDTLDVHKYGEIYVAPNLFGKGAAAIPAQAAREQGAGAGYIQDVE